MRKFTLSLLTAALTLGTFALCTSSSCLKDPCIDETIRARHMNDICPEDCPGVIGCDGKLYCNLCEANRNGVSWIK